MGHPIPHRPAHQAITHSRGRGHAITQTPGAQLPTAEVPNPS
jgi:hypothetical protein